MRLHPKVLKGYRLSVLGLALAWLPLLGGCAKAPLMGKGTLRVVVMASRDCNNCGKTTGFPLTYRVLQVSDASAIAGLSLTQLWDKEEKILGPALLKKTESYVDPGQTKELPVEREKGATAMIVVGNFCRTKGSCWNHVQPLSAGGTVKLSAGSNCFTLTK